MKVSLKAISFIVFYCAAIVPAYSQTTTNTKKAPPSGGASSLSADKSTMLCKAWKLDTVSEFGVDSKPKPKEVGDGITFVADGSLFFTMEGEATTGKWTYSASRINTVTPNQNENLSFKIISLADNRLVLEYQTRNLERVKYVYHPKK